MACSSSASTVLVHKNSIVANASILQFLFLSLAIQQGIRELIVRANMGLVYQIAMTSQVKYQEPLDDLVQSGTIGLIKAVDRYDPQRNSRFSSFASPYIRGAIAQYVRDRCQPLKIPRPYLDLFPKVSQCEGLSEPEAARKLGVSLERYRDIVGAIAANQCRSLQQISDCARVRKVRPIALPPQQRRQQAKEQLSKKLSADSTYLVQWLSQQAPRCPHCQSVDFIKKGMRDGEQRYRCRTCGKFFRLTPTVACKSNALKIAAIEKREAGQSYRQIAYLLGISPKQAHQWWHQATAFLSA